MISRWKTYDLIMINFDNQIFFIIIIIFLSLLELKPFAMKIYKTKANADVFPGKISHLIYKQNNCRFLGNILIINRNYVEFRLDRIDKQLFDWSFFYLVSNKILNKSIRKKHAHYDMIWWFYRGQDLRWRNHIISNNRFVCKFPNSYCYRIHVSIVRLLVDEWNFSLIKHT